MTSEREHKRKRREIEDALRDPATHMVNATEVHVMDVDIMTGDILRNDAERGDAVTGQEGYIGDVALNGNVVITHMEDYERLPNAQHRYPLFSEAFHTLVKQIRKAHRRSDNASPE
jgi:hypothetical protein